MPLSGRSGEMGSADGYNREAWAMVFAGLVVRLWCAGVAILASVGRWPKGKLQGSKSASLYVVAAGPSRS